MQTLSICCHLKAGSKLSLQFSFRIEVINHWFDINILLTNFCNTLLSVVKVFRQNFSLHVIL